MTDPLNAREAADTAWIKESKPARETRNNRNGRDDAPPPEFDAFTPPSYGEEPGAHGTGAEIPVLEVEDAGNIDTEPIPPREWVFGNRYCLGFVSGNIGDGGVGKTALAILDGLSISSGRSLTGEHLFRSERVLIVCLEDQRKEIRRRIKAALVHHDIDPSTVQGRLFFCAHKGEKIMVRNANGQLAPGNLGPMIRAELTQHNTKVLIVEPLIKSHSLDENSNVDMDAVIDAFVAMAEEENVAIMLTQHTRKGLNVAGNPDIGRGATAVKNGARLVYTTVAMNDKEQALYGLNNEAAKSLIRVDSAKVNICRPELAKWFKLVGVKIGNATEMCPNGDEIQTAEPWNPPNLFANTVTETLNKILDHIERGMDDGARYSGAAAATKRAAWPIVQEYLPDKNEKQCRAIISTWIENEVLVSREYDDPVRRSPATGLFVNPAKRPGNETRF